MNLIRKQQDIAKQESRQFQPTQLIKKIIIALL